MKSHGLQGLCVLAMALSQSLLPAALDPDRDPIDVYETDQNYWHSLRYFPPGTVSSPPKANASQ